MNFDAVIFDLDGTLVHTTPDYRYQVVGKTLEKLGITSSQENIDRFWFESNRDEIIASTFGVSPKTFWEAYQNYDKVDLRRKCTVPYSDVSFVNELKRYGFKTGIVTGAPFHIASLEIGLIGEENFDNVIIAQASAGIRPKPHPHGLVHCLDLLGVTTDKAIYVGNALEDIETARSAGVFDVLVDRGEYSFPNITPSKKVSSLYDLRDFLGI